MMQITPAIPDEYNGPVKRFVCLHCQRISYVTLADYQEMGGEICCHECSVRRLNEGEEKKKLQTYPSGRQYSAWKPISRKHEKAYLDVFHAEHPHECSDHCRDFAIILLNNKLTPVLVNEKSYQGEKFSHITRFHVLEDYRGNTIEDAIAFVGQKVAGRAKGLTALEFRRICELLCQFSRRTQAIEAHFEEVARERLRERGEIVTEETLAQELKRVEIEETPLATAIIAMMQERSKWQGKSDQLRKALRPHLEEQPTLFTDVLKHVATLLPVQGLSITLDDENAGITIEKA
jgi:hypothetical protein